MAQINSDDILYSFRRCPYAMRARLALMTSGADPRVREIILRDKPDEMLAANPKGTVPVLVLSDGQVIAESYDIMLYALSVNDPKNWLNVFDGKDESIAQTFIKENDTIYKAGLDRYKYPSRFEDEGEPESLRQKGRAIVIAQFDRLNTQLAASGGKALFTDFSIADAAILPFIRQAAYVNKDYFKTLPFPHLQKWLNDFLKSELFLSVMPKLKIWKETGQEYSLQKLPI